MDKLKTAVIGCGGHAQSHFQMIAADPRLQLEAIADIDAQRLSDNAARHQPAHSFADYRQMLDDCSLDLVHVITMPGPIVPIVLECLQRGLHVSVEKPPGMSAAQTQTMAQAAAASRGKAMVSFNRRYFPQILRLRQLVQAQGGTVHCAATYNKPLTLLGTPAMSQTPDPVICDAIHHVDLLRWLAGEGERAALPVAVHAEVADGSRPGAHRHNAVIRFDSGAIATFSSHYGVGARIQRAEVHAEDLSAYLDLTGPPRCELYTAAATPRGDAHGALVETPLDLEPVGGPDFDETRHFVDCIIEDRQPWSPLDDAVHTMRLCEAIRRGHKGSV